MPARAARSTERGERRLTWTLLGLVVLCPAAAGAAWFLLWQRPLAARAAALGQRLQRVSAPLAGARWRRPVLRGVARPGNAASLAARALVPSGMLPSGVDLFEALESGKPPSPELDALIRRVGPRLDAFQAATQAGFAWALDPALGGGGRTVDNVAHLDSVELLLLRASTLPADTCLRAATDAARLAQDLMPGGGLDRVEIASVEFSAVVPVALRCATHASAGELAAAQAETDSLAAHWPPIASALNVEALVTARGFQSDFTLRSWLPKLTGAPLDRARDNPWKLLNAWQASLDAAAHFAGVDPKAPPSYAAERATLDAALGDSAWRGNPLLDASHLRAGAEKAIARDTKALALVRALAGVLAVLSARTEKGELPAAAPAVLSRPALADPFSDAPLLFERAPDGLSGRVYSVGPNGRDDDGRDDDVAVAVPRWRPKLPHWRGP